MKYLVFFLLFFIPAISIAQYEPIVGLPGVAPDPDFNTYINTIYALSIGLAALLAVVKIIIAGVKWMLTDIVTSKEEAKKDIKGALLGLLIILSAVLIISVINEDILDVKLELQAQKAPPEPAPPTEHGLAMAAIPGVIGSQHYHQIFSLGAEPSKIKAFKNQCSKAGFKLKKFRGNHYCLKTGPLGGVKITDGCTYPFSCKSGALFHQANIDWCAAGTLSLNRTHDKNDDDLLICTW